MWSKEVLLFFSDMMQSGVKVPEHKAWFPSTRCGGMVLELIPILITNIVKLFPLVGGVGAEEMCRA